MEAIAKLRFLRQSPRKVRLVADAIRGQRVDRAVSELSFSPRTAARAVLKLLNSALANAIHNFHLDKENLFIKEIRVDQGPALKRWKPRAFGRASGLRKETSHITIVLAEIKPSKETSKDKNKEKPGPKMEAAKVVNSLDEVKESILDDDKDIGSKSAEKKSGSKNFGEKGKKRFFSRKSG
ncbi:50S ribosomal protein L22 [Candidatus Kuenenbacteria bacterium]|nr:50S ribosomal protein L22 [Candidatus Kuenenbacteria bacterium]